MIIDCHTHIFPKEIIEHRDRFCLKDEGFASIYNNTMATLINVEELIREMDDSEIDKAVICGFHWNDPEICHIHNQYLLESASRYPNRLIAFIILPFSNPQAAEREFESVLNNGAKGVGEVAFYHRVMTQQDIYLMSKFLKEMEVLKIPLLIHTNETIGHNYPGKGKTPLERFYELIVSFPNLPLIFAHWGGGLAFYEMMPENAKIMKNVYYDTAASPYLYNKRIYKIMCEMVGVKKILFGSDYPLIRPKRYFKEIQDSGISEEDKVKILGLNFLELF